MYILSNLLIINFFSYFNIPFMFILGCGELLTYM